MDMINFNVSDLNEAIKIRPQFPDKPNLLTKELETATGFTDTDALRIQASVCKAITFWFEAFYKGLMTMNFSDYYKYCIDNKYIRKEDAWLNLEFGFVAGLLRTEMADKFGIKIIGFDDLTKFNKWADTQEKFLGTLRIVNASNTGKHSLITYKDESKKFISDTGSRGIATPFDKKINAKNFIYFTCMTGKVS